MQDKAFDLEFNLSKEMPSKNQVFEFNPEKEEVKNPASLNEEALLNDGTAVVELVTDKNDIEPIDRAKQLKISNRISRHTVEKLAQREAQGPTDKVIIPPKIIKKAIKST